jgi:pyridoxal phosphate enzyme (YggS family)
VSASDVRLLLKDRLAAVEDRIAAACRRSGRPREAVTLVAVTKTVGPDVAALLPQLGVADLGENRPQELWRKAAAVPGPVRWHLIGHLQRNKAARTVPLTHLIHSVDSERLLASLDQEAGRLGRTVPVLLEVNASGETQKGGFAPDALPALVDPLARLRNVQVVGLMTMAALEADPERCRPTFAALRELRDRLSGGLPSPHRLDHLSMGMTNDFEVAVEEGATLVRVGTALFEGLAEAEP